MERVLVADTEPESLELLSRELENIGLVPITATSGILVEGLLLANPDFALVILDTHLPDVSARELTLRLRTHSALKELPIIIMSPMVKLRDIDELLRLGASYFVPRPVKWPLLRDLVQRIIARRACRAQCLES